MSTENDPSRFTEPGRKTAADLDYRVRMQEYFDDSIGSVLEKLENFAKYVPRQRLTNFLSKYEIFKRILNVQGSIVECGVLFGGGLMAWAQLSAILEPVNYQRQILGFDTFSGFPELDSEDKPGKSHFCQAGGLNVDSYDDMLKCIELYDTNRFLGHLPKVKLVRGDACSTIPEFLESNPQLVVSLLYLDFDIFEPTKTAIENLVPRMPKGAVIAFDELNYENFPGETTAVLKTVGVRNLRIERFAFDTFVSFAVLD